MALFLLGTMVPDNEKTTGRLHPHRAHPRGGDHRDHHGPLDAHVPQLLPGRPAPGSGRGSGDLPQPGAPDGHHTERIDLCAHHLDGNALPSGRLRGRDVDRAWHRCRRQYRRAPGHHALDHRESGLQLPGRNDPGRDLHAHAHAVEQIGQRRGGFVRPRLHHPRRDNDLLLRTRALTPTVGDRRGITLVEVIVAVGVITVGLSALLAAVPSASYGTREGYQLSTATFLANERLEQVRNARWQSEPRPVDELGVSPAPTSAPESGAAATFADEAALPAPYGDYARAVRI